MTEIWQLFGGLFIALIFASTVGYCSRSRILGNVTAKSENSEKSVISHFKRILTANFEKRKRPLN